MREKILTVKLTQKKELSVKYLGNDRRSQSAAGGSRVLIKTQPDKIFD